MAAKTFWTSPLHTSLYTPKQKHLFMVRIGQNKIDETSNYYPGATPPSVKLNEKTGFYMWGPDGDKYDGEQGRVWYAKTVTKPNVSFEKDASSDMYRQGARPGLRDFNYRSTPLFQDIKLTLIDPTYPNATRKLLRILNKITDINGIPTKTLANPYLSPFRITQYSHDPTKPVAGKLYRTEEWVLHGPQLVSVDFGSLDYSSDEFVEIAMTIAYTGYICTVYNFGGEGEKEYKSFYETREAEAEPEPVAAAKKKKKKKKKKGKEEQPEEPNRSNNSDLPAKVAG